MSTLASPATTSRPVVPGVLAAISTSHVVNDMMQSLILAIYPVIKGGFNLSFTQIGLITLTYQLTASIFQPLIGMATDRRPAPYSLPIGMASTLCGMLLLGFAPNYAVVLMAAAMVGIGSAIFHPEASRIARLASGGRHGFAQSVFQVGGNFGTALGPLIAAAVIVPYGQRAASWFAGAALIGIALLTYVGRWYALHLGTPRPASTASMAPRHPPRTVAKVLAILLVLIFSKYFYMASIGSYFTFYLIHHFGIPVAQAQLHLFAFLVASAAGGFLGGPLGDRIGRKPIIWTSILGVAPFALMLPHADLLWTTVLAVLIGFVLSSAFSAIVVYAQEMMPHRIGMVSGLFFGFAFGMGGLGAAVLGMLADRTSIEYVYQLTAFLPLLGIVAAWLPPSRPAAH
ncbi:MULTISPECIES: MFS transporter [unclassified Stenotrophomonas]|uniref:MFS transporter n=1 Tax=unclassified Stenotrophomonas TaxID=196198 RepID=UPI00044AF3B8|nr:Fosmidomycin resistance protein [Stenotrophomonas maltophilia M30]MBA0457907.1 MFS transporter [Stenotrophomonas maltophilia]MBH1395197.1 MFS transporter [Stenotrophomonas maltophilia]MCI1050094.1 MFS transporter [Stenotrophomonas maltophilia]